MANFIEFLKSGKSAREFIDTAVLPQNVLSIEKMPLSPKPYQDEDLDINHSEDIDTVIDNASVPDSDSDEEGIDLEGDTGQSMIENTDEESDPVFLAALEIVEKECLDQE
jgi:hypothetical protein